jgi:hypothetical protein
MNAQIAQHLNIAESAIIRIEEWANVLFVVCRKLGGRFVSKRVAKVEVKEQLSVAEMEKVGNRWQKNGMDRIYFDATWIARELGLSNSKSRKIAGAKLYYDCLDGQFYHNMSTEGNEAIRHIQRLCTVTVTAASTPETMQQRKCCNCGTWTSDVSQFSYFLAGSIGTLCADCYDSVEAGL